MSYNHDAEIAEAADRLEQQEARALEQADGPSKSFVDAVNELRYCHDTASTRYLKSEVVARLGTLRTTTTNMAMRLDPATVAADLHAVREALDEAWRAVGAWATAMDEEAKKS